MPIGWFFFLMDVNVFLITISGIRNSKKYSSRIRIWNKSFCALLFGIFLGQALYMTFRMYDTLACQLGLTAKNLFRKIEDDKKFSNLRNSKCTFFCLFNISRKEKNDFHETLISTHSMNIYIRLFRYKDIWVIFFKEEKTLLTMTCTV